MKKLKKILSLCVALAILSISSSGFSAFFKPGDEYINGDTAPTADQEFVPEAGVVGYSDMEDLSVVGILGALKIMGAYEDSAFKPNVYVSRGEFADGALNMMGVFTNQMDGSIKGSFYDVGAEHPYYERIYEGVARGILTGYDDNSYRPDSVISYEEALKIMLRCLGYNDDLISMQGGVFNAAAMAEISKGIKVVNNEALTRLEEAKLILNTLEAYPITLKTKSGKQTIEKDNETLLKSRFGLTKGNGIVDANRVGKLFDNLSSAKGCLSIDGKVYSVSTDAYNKYLGYKVEFYYDEDNSLIIAYPHEKVKKITVEAEDVLGYNRSARTFSYEGESGKSKTVKLSQGFNLIYNGAVPKENYDEDIFLIENGSITFLSNNGDGNYDTAVIEEYKNFILNKTSCTDYEITLFLDEVGAVLVNADNGFIEAYNENLSSVSIYKQTGNGEDIISVTDFPKDSVVSVFTSLSGYETDAITGNIKPKDNPEYVKLVFSKNTVSGRVTGKKAEDNKLTIGGTEYEIAKGADFRRDMSDITFDEHTFYLDYKGFVVSMKESDSAWKYGYLIRPYFDSDDSLKSVTGLKVLTSSGEIAKFSVTDKLRLNKKANSSKYIIIDEIKKSAALLNNYGFEYSQVIKYLITEDNILTDIQTVTESVGIAPEFDEEQLKRDKEPSQYIVENDSSSRLTNPDDTAISYYFKPRLMFKVPTTENQADNMYGITSIGSSGGRVTLEVYDVDDLRPSVCVYYNNTGADSWIATGKYNTGVWPVMFSEAYNAVNDDDMAVLKILVSQGSGAKEYYSENLSLADGIKKGQLIYLKGQGDKITDIDFLCYNDIPIGPDNIPPATAYGRINTKISGNHTGGDLGIYPAEVYKLCAAAADFILQAGPMTGALERETQFTGSIMNDFWFMGGMMVYDQESDEVRLGQKADLKAAVDYGNERSSKVVGFMHVGAARAYYVYNME